MYIWLILRNTLNLSSFDLLAIYSLTTFLEYAATEDVRSTIPARCNMAL